MGTTQTLSDLRGRVRSRVALPSTSDPSDTVLDQLLNESLSRYWTELASTDDDRETLSVAFVVANDTACTVGTSTPLTTTSWLHLRAVKITMSGRERDVQPKPLGDPDGSGLWDPFGDRRIRYRFLGGVLKFVPTNRVNGYTGTVYYVPDWTPLTGSNTVLDRDGWIQLAVLETCCKVRKLHRLDASDLEAELADTRQYVGSVKRRNKGAPSSFCRRIGW